MQRICPILDRLTDVEPTEYSRDEWTIVRCRETGFVFLADPPDYSRLCEEFAWESTSASNRKQRNQKQPIVETVSSVIKKFKNTLLSSRNPFISLIRDHAPRRNSLTLLDVGCASGRLMEGICARFAPADRLIRPIGIEVSRKLAAECDERFASLGGYAICSNALDGADQLAAGSIDVVVLSTFLEHEYQPLKLLKRLEPALADDGVMILKVPNFNSWNRHIRGKRWPGFRYPDHVNYFTPETLARLVQEADLEVSRQKIWDKLPLSDNMYAVLKKQEEEAAIPRKAA